DRWRFRNRVWRGRGECDAPVAGQPAVPGAVVRAEHFFLRRFARFGRTALVRRGHNRPGVGRGDAPPGRGLRPGAPGTLHRRTERPLRPQAGDGGVRPRAGPPGGPRRPDAAFAAPAPGAGGVARRRRAGLRAGEPGGGSVPGSRPRPGGRKLGDRVRHQRRRGFRPSPVRGAPAARGRAWRAAGGRRHLPGLGGAARLLAFAAGCSCRGRRSGLIPARRQGGPGLHPVRPPDPYHRARVLRRRRLQRYRRRRPGLPRQGLSGRREFRGELPVRGGGRRASGGLCAVGPPRRTFPDGPNAPRGIRREQRRQPLQRPRLGRGRRLRVAGRARGGDRRDGRRHQHPPAAHGAPGDAGARLRQPLRCDRGRGRGLLRSRRVPAGPHFAARGVRRRRSGGPARHSCRRPGASARDEGHRDPNGDTGPEGGYRHRYRL
ncbi:MAG: transporter, putative, partial [uncultured Rubrobacteraceae bacterium]